MTVCTRKKDGQIFVQWEEGGKFKREYFGVGMEAKARAETFNSTKVKKKKRVIKTGPTFQELAQAYLTSKEKTQFSEATMKNIGWRFRKIIPFFGDMVVVNIRRTDFDKFIALRSKTVKMTTIRRDLTDIRAILNWSVDCKYITRSPMAGYRFPKRVNEKRRPPSKDEIERLISVAPPHLRRAILLSYFLGLRPGAVELLSLKYNLIDWSAMTITVVSANKGGAESREVPIHASLPIREWYEEDGSKDDKHIITWRGKPVSRITKGFDLAKRRAGIDRSRRLPMYSLRHAFVTTLLRAKVDAATICSITGHSIRTMLEFYADVIDDARVGAIAVLPPI